MQNLALSQTNDRIPPLHGARPRIDDHDAIAPDLAFLFERGIARGTLLAASRRAARDGVDVYTSLLAYGGISHALFYQCVAHRLGVPFVMGGAVLDSATNARDVIRKGIARLAAGSDREWLIAPGTDGIRMLIRARSDSSTRFTKIAMTTPGHLAALARDKDAPRLRRDATETLSRKDPALSARNAVSRRTLIAFAAVVGFTILAPRGLAATLVGLVFLAALSFRLLVGEYDRHTAIRPAERIGDLEAPVVSILVPLYKEADMVERLVARLDRLDYPRSKLQIIFLLEPDDRETLFALRCQPLSPICEIVVAPDGLPRTKPRALNVALPLIKGEIVAVFDAEDSPDIDQIRIAAAGFRAGPANLACVQASLSIDNGRTNLLTRLFAIEYAALFDVYNRSVAAAGLPLALGGTSNYFRVATLKDIGGWDAWNVAEDADIGFRLARFGYATAVIASTTSEEAPTHLPGWFKQRRRWTKGWMQTALVLARDPVRVGRELGARRSAALAMMVVTLVIGPILSLPMTIMVAMQVAQYGPPWPRGVIDILQATLWTSVFTIGACGTLWTAYAGIRARRMNVGLATAVAFVPYQLLIGVAALAGLSDLLTNPYHWHKTDHGADRRADTADHDHRHEGPTASSPWHATGKGRLKRLSAGRPLFRFKGRRAPTAGARSKAR